MSQEANRRAAELMQAEGAAPHVVARHLLASEPLHEPWAAEVLRTTAREALAAGDPGTAVRHLERAADECPDDAARSEVMLELARAKIRIDNDGTVHSVARAVHLAPCVAAKVRAVPGLLELLLLLRDEEEPLHPVIASLVPDDGRPAPDRGPADTDVPAEGPDAGHAAPIPGIGTADYEGGRAALRTATAGLVAALRSTVPSPGVAVAEEVTTMLLGDDADLIAHLRAAQVLAWAGRLRDALERCEAVLTTARRWNHQPLTA
ncbi:hypothetical protein GT002_36510, partial [Streptomyces sp. SID4917]|nr:hypothetical protein [Streptomyces sp. SID4917]